MNKYSLSERFSLTPLQFYSTFTAKFIKDITVKHHIGLKYLVANISRRQINRLAEKNHRNLHKRSWIIHTYRTFQLKANNTLSDSNGIFHGGGHQANLRSSSHSWSQRTRRKDTTRRVVLPEYPADFESKNLQCIFLQVRP